ncbi:hypothetical protein BGZ72_001590 [Mortierella alpina]|nr:hypothetical protein BGZ72_001590 [Mortierella alpina]
MPDRVVDIIKLSTIFNSCTLAIERSSSVTGHPSGMRDVVKALEYKGYESVSYGLAAVYDYRATGELYD